MKKRKFLLLLITYGLLTFGLIGCGGTAPAPVSDTDINASSENTGSQDAPDRNVPMTPVPGAPSPNKTKDEAPDKTPLRDNTPVCLIPLADGIRETRNDVAVIDYSYAQDGYICAAYTGDCPKLKLRITGPDDITYTYDLHHDGYETFPLSSGSGDYKVTIYENISGTSYSTCLYETVTADITNEFSPFLYPNQYVNFGADSETVAKAAELAEGASNDLEVISGIYNYIISNITYDYDKASHPPTGYTTNVDEILSSGTGICLDYAAVMTAMLRSQQIPARLEIGYAQDAYHAWLSAYTKETGWLNGIIEFSGDTWTLVDPTFGANTDNKTLKKFIGDGSNYILQNMY